MTEEVIGNEMTEYFMNLTNKAGTPDERVRAGVKDFMRKYMGNLSYFVHPFVAQKTIGEKDSVERLVTAGLAENSNHAKEILEELIDKRLHTSNSTGTWLKIKKLQNTAGEKFYRVDRLGAYE
jgi:hypothetical protein